VRANYCTLRSALHIDIANVLKHIVAWRTFHAVGMER